MLGIDEIIVNNKLTTGLGEFIIHIDHAVVTNTLSNTYFNICLESTGATVDGVFRTFRDYVFFIQNNLMQHSGMCISYNNLVMNSRRVRLENSEGNITRAAIVDNVLIQLRPGEEYDFVPNALLDPVEPIIPRINANIPVVESSLREIARNGQNVHNSTVVLKFKTLYEKLMEQLLDAVNTYDINNFSIDSAYINLMNNSGYNNSIFCYKNTKLKTLMNVLEHSKKQNGFIFNMDETEGNIFKHIILYINNCVEQSYKADTFKLLADNMIDCLENGGIVCLTGRITRMLNSVEHLVSYKDESDDESDEGNKKNSSSCIDDIRQEMLAKAMVMFNSEFKISDIKEALSLDYPNVDKDNLNTEIDSWNLEDLY